MEIDLNPFILIFAIAIIVAILAKRARLPYTISLVIAGIVVAFIGIEAPFKLDRDLIFHILLPPLLFEAGLHMRLTHLRENAKTITLLVLPGLVVSLIVVSLVLGVVFPAIPFMIILLFVAIIIPTDPVSILALFKEMKVPRHVSILVEGESVFNDGVAIVIFNVILGLILVSGQNVSLTSGDIALGIFEFLKLTILGVLLGSGIGYMGYLVIRKIDDRFTEVMITIILAFSTYAVAEALGGSGVFAVVFSALVLGNYGTRFAMAPSTRMTLLNFWAFLAFAVNSFLFLLIGMDVHFSGNTVEMGLIIAGTVMLFVSRAGMVFVVGKIVNHKRTELPRRWQAIIWWGGIRGAIPIAMALSIPTTLLVLDNAGNAVVFPFREQLKAATFGVVLFSLLIQGLTLKPVLKALGFSTMSKKGAEREEKEISVLLRDSMNELSTLRDDGELSSKGYEVLIAKYGQANSQLLTELGMLINEHGFIPKDEYSFAVKEALMAKKDAVKDTWERNIISGASGEKLITELDEQINNLSIDDEDSPKSPVEVLRRVTRPASNDSANVLERTCGICLQPMEPDDPCTKCRCGTVFHKSCLEGVERCPICIAVLDKDAETEKVTPDHLDGQKL